MIAFGWAVAVTSLLPVFLQRSVEVGGYGFNPLQYAAFTFSAWIGAICAEIYGVALNDRLPIWMCRRQARKLEAGVSPLPECDSASGDVVHCVWRHRRQPAVSPPSYRTGSGGLPGQLLRHLRATYRQQLCRGELHLSPFRGKHDYVILPSESGALRTILH